MKSFFRAFTLTMLVLFVPLIAFAAVLRADEVTRRVGYDDLSPAVSVSESEIVIFGESYDRISNDEKIKQAKSYLTLPAVKLDIMIIQTISELIAQSAA